MTTVDQPTTIVTEPGLYDGMPDAIYHGDPVPAGSLSSSGARRLLPPHCPARYRWEQDNGRPPNQAFDIGHAAHLEVLGVGLNIAVVPAADWRTKAAREMRDEAYAAGNVPILEADYLMVLDLAAAIRRHPLAAALFNPDAGKAEQSAFWTDPATGVWRRSRFDFLRANEVVDLKTCASADPDHIQKAIHSYGYHQQAAWYLDAVRDLGLAEDPAFVFVFVEKQPPHLVHVVQLDADALAAGAVLNRRAIDTYAECTRTGQWPGYADDKAITTVSLPAYATRTQEF